MKVEQVIGFLAITILILAVVLPALMPPPSLDLKARNIIKEIISGLARGPWGVKKLILEEKYNINDFESERIAVNVFLKSSYIDISPVSGDTVLYVKAYGSSSSEVKLDVNREKGLISIYGGSARVHVYINEKYLEEFNISFSSSSVDISLNEVTYTLKIDSKSSMLLARIVYEGESTTKIAIRSSFGEIDVLYPRTKGLKLGLEVTSSLVNLGGEFDESITQGSFTYGEGMVSFEAVIESSYVKLKVSGK